MIELGAIALSIGAIVYSIGLPLYSVCIITLCLGGFVFMRSVSIRGLFFICILCCISVLGFLYSSHAETTVAIPHGEYAFTAQVVRTTRELDQSVTIVSFENTSSFVQLYSAPVSVLPGDSIKVHGRIQKPKDFVSDTGRVFHYQDYLESKRIVAVMYQPEITIIEHGSFSITRIATVVRFAVASIFSRYIAFPVDGIVAGMLVGYQGGIPEYVTELFRDTGVLHVLVLSGYNITLLVGFLGMLLRRAPFRIRSIGIAFSIIFLVMLSGSGVASIRAGIMGLIALLAGVTLRTYQPLRALTIAYIVFFVLSPQTVFVDPGFHLSFLATLYMVVVLPKVIGHFSFIPEYAHANLREIFVLAITIPLFMLPYTMYFSGVLPLATLGANIVFAFLTPIIMLAGSLVLMVAWCAPLAHVIGSTIGVVGGGLLSVLVALNHMPQWHTPSLSGWGVLSVYSGILGLLFRKEVTLFVIHLRSVLLQHPSASVQENQ